MENKDTDSLSNEHHGELNPEKTTSPAGDSPYSSTDETAHQGNTEQDEILRDMLSEYNPSSKVEGWDKIAASLDTADEAFDHDVRNRIHHYHASYDPHSWPKFAKRFTDHKHLRTRLIVLKLSEAAAILLLMLTILHLGHEGRLPFQDTHAEALASPPPQLPAATIQHENDESELPGQLDKKQIAERSPGAKSSTSSAAEIKSNRIKEDHKISQHDIVVPLSNIQSLTDSEGILFANTFPAEIEPDVPLVKVFQSEDLVEDKSGNTRSGFDLASQFLPLVKPSLVYAHQNQIQKPTLVAASSGTYVEFGMLAQADYNQLKMPEDRLNNDGEQIIFPLQGITSPGFGAGFTLALAHPRWAAETGVIYNAKTFRPGRELTIGNEADNTNVEYEAMHMQLVSVPLQFRYRFDKKSRMKTYGFAGFGLHIIAQSDIDVKVDHNFPSLPAGEDPNNNPSLARNIRQAQRVSEDIRDRAPFSTNSYISANLGLGLEYELLDRKTLFLQTAYQYQIPNIRFSNHNGKHVLSLSLQAGVRTPLGN